MANAEHNESTIERRYILLIVGLILFFLLATVIAMQIGKSSGPIAKGSSTTYRVKGTALKNARPLVSKRQQHNPSTSAAPNKNAPPNPAQPTEPNPKPPPPQSPPPATTTPANTDTSPIDKAVQEALNALDPETGIAQLESALNKLDNLAGASSIYLGLAKLYGQCQPPKPEKIQECYTWANSLAPNAATRQETARQEAMALLAQGASDEAQNRIVQALKDDKDITQARLELLILHGKLQQDKGDQESALKSYREATQLTADELAAMGEQAQDVYRQACLREARLLREMGRNDEADEVAREMHQHIRTVTRQTE